MKAGQGAETPPPAKDVRGGRHPRYTKRSHSHAPVQSPRTGKSRTLRSAKLGGEEKRPGGPFVVREGTAQPLRLLCRGGVYLHPVHPCRARARAFQKRRRVGSHETREGAFRDYRYVARGGAGCKAGAEGNGHLTGSFSCAPRRICYSLSKFPQ